MTKLVLKTILAMVSIASASPCSANSRVTILTDVAVRDQQIRLVEAEVTKVDAMLKVVQITDLLRENLVRSKAAQICKATSEKKICWDLGNDLGKILGIANRSFEETETNITRAQKQSIEKAKTSIAFDKQALNSAEDYLLFRRERLKTQIFAAQQLAAGGITAAALGDYDLRPRSNWHQEAVEKIVASLTQFSAELKTILKRERADLAFVSKTI